MQHVLRHAFSKRRWDRSGGEDRVSVNGPISTSQLQSGVDIQTG